MPSNDTPSLTSAISAVHRARELAQAEQITPPVPEALPELRSDYVAELAAYRAILRAGGTLEYAELLALTLADRLDAQQKGVYDDIRTERARQDAQWGGVDNDDANTAKDWQVYRRKFERRAMTNGARRRDALVKIAALAVAQIEALDRQAALVQS